MSDNWIWADGDNVVWADGDSAVWATIVSLNYDTFPSIAPAIEEFWLRGNSITGRSVFTGSAQTREFPGARWVSKVEFPPLTQSRWRSLGAFVDKQVGQSGRFFYGPQYAAMPRAGVAPTAITVSGSDQTGRSIVTAGWTPNSTVLYAGDYFSYDTESGRELKRVVGDVTSDVSGIATLTFVPPIRVSPSDGSVLDFSNPTCLMKLTNDENPMRFTPGRIGGLAYVTLDLEEVF